MVDIKLIIDKLVIVQIVKIDCMDFRDCKDLIAIAIDLPIVIE